MDFSPETKTAITYKDENSWIPRLELGAILTGVMFKGDLFVCDRDSKCKSLPIGSPQWLDAPSYEAPFRNYAAMTVVDDERVMISGGRLSISGKYLATTFFIYFLNRNSILLYSFLNFNSQGL